MEKLFELTFQDQTLNPQVGAFTDASQTTGTFTLEDGEYYLTNADTKGFYAYAPIAIQPDSETDNKVTVEFDLKVVTASVNTHTIISTYAGVDSGGIPTGAKITLQYNAGDIELVLGSGTTETLIAAADVVVDQWYHFRIGCALDAPVESTYEVKIDGAAVTTVTGATTDYELGIISVLGTDLHACDECGIKNIRLITDDDYFVGRTALGQVLQDVKGYVDTTKIPLAGSNQISGSLIPSTDNSIDIGSSTKNIKALYTKGITINGTQFLPSDYATLSGLATVATSGNYNDLSNKPTIPTVNNATLTIQKNGTTVKTFTANASSNVTANITVPTKTSDLTNDSGFITSDNTKIPLAGSNAISGSLIPATDNSIDIGSSAKNIKMLYTKGITINGTQFLPSDYVPKSGGAVMTGLTLGRNVNNSFLEVKGGSNGGAAVGVNGKNHPTAPGNAYIISSNDNSTHTMVLHSNGNWTWDGQAVQLVSDQRYKQQIAEIDDKLLDAWKDVTLVQFKYNDAVSGKGDNARLHTGYVVQQINSACKSHGVDISQYGLYCHEEYPQEVEEVEIEQADGTKTKERKVIREASEHYSLRYTEVYAVECMYLRRCIERLTARIEQLEKEQEASK